MARCYHVVTFDPARKDVGFSVNAKSGLAQGYANRPIPNGSVHVISTGYCKGQYRSVEALIEQPPFNYAIASAGPIISQTPLRVEGTPSKQAFLGTGKPLPGHLTSNHNGGISVSGNGSLTSFISGFARASGSVQLDPGGVAKLGLRPNSAPLTLPNIDVNSYDTLSVPGVKSISTSSCSLKTIDKAYRATQDTNFTERTQLNNGYVYVKGNANFQQGLQGSGAIVVDGDLTIQGAGSVLRATDTVAILATGKVTITGDPSNTVDAATMGTGGANANYFAGLVYAGKGVDLQNLTVAGVVLTKDANSTSTLKNTNFLYCADAGNISITVPPEFTVTSPGSPEVYVGTVVGGKFVPATNPHDPAATVFVGPPPGVTDYLSFIQNNRPVDQLYPGLGPLDAFLTNALTNNGANVQLGQTSAGNQPLLSFQDPGYLEAMNVEYMANKGQVGSKAYQAAMSDMIKAMTKGGTQSYQPQTVTATPGGTFNLVLNNFLPRSSTLRLASYSLHSGKL